jgi:hypothetical protein
LKKSSPAPAGRLALLGCVLALAQGGGLAAKPPGCPGYAELRPLLNSQRIESCFGSYGVEVLKQEGNLRIVSLYSQDGQGRFTRTLAISEFADDLPLDLQPAYQAIREGASMGATLQAAGWNVEKRDRYLGQLPASGVAACLSGWAQPTTEASAAQAELAVQVYDLYVYRGDESVRFALLAEIHDPGYLDLHDLRALAEPESESLTHGTDDGAAGVLQQLAGLCAMPR